MSRITNAIHNLTGALADTGFPPNPVVVDALKIIAAHVDRLCPACNGRGKVRANVCQDDLRGDIVDCRPCKGTGRAVKKIPMRTRYCTCVELREDLGPLADPDCPDCDGHGWCDMSERVVCENSNCDNPCGGNKNCPNYRGKE